MSQSKAMWTSLLALSYFDEQWAAIKPPSTVVSNAGLHLREMQMSDSVKMQPKYGSLNAQKSDYTHCSLSGVNKNCSGC